MRISFKVSLTVSIMAVVGSLSLIFFIHIRSISEKASLDAAGSLFNSAFTTIETSAFDLIQDAFDAVHLASQLDEAVVREENIAGSAPLRIILQLLKQNPALYSVYFGYQDSRFFQIISVKNDPLIIGAQQAPAGTWWILRSIYLGEGGKREQDWFFTDENLQVLAKRSEPDPDYDPRTRPWYQLAEKSDQPALSGVYIFNSLQKPGITASKVTAKGNGIAGVDLTLKQLKHLVSTIRISENCRVLIVDEKNRIIAASGTLESIGIQGNRHPGTLPATFTIDSSPGLRHLKADGQIYYTKTSRTIGASLRVVAVAPVNDFNHHFARMQNNLAAITLVWLLLFVPVTYFFSRHMSNRLSLIASDAVRIKDFNFTPKDRNPSHILEFYLLEENFDAMRASLFQKTQDLKITQAKLNRLVELGIALSAERDAEKLMERVLIAAKELTNADAGTLYKIEEESLKFKILHNDSLGIAATTPASLEERISQNPVPLYDDQGRQNHHNVVSHAIWESRSIMIRDAYDNAAYDFSGTRDFDRINGYHSKSFMTIPLIPLGGKPIGALQLINCKDDDGSVIPFGDDLLRFVEALGAQAAIILYNLELIEGQKRLLESMIQILAGAIDAKSPYTGGHCKRVPELAMMIARKACQRTDGSFADFTFQEEDQWREFSIAAWLHDCGKVVTPEYVVDKATKLETIYNRIHEIRTRFEVLLRDAQVAYYKGLCRGGDQEALAGTYEERKKDLMDKFAFVARCNVGGESMADDEIERLRSIAREEWVRHFDIRLGLSHEEARLFMGTALPPARENLLADQPFHIIERTDTSDPYAGLGLKVPVPEHLYNRGEIYNLSVRRGTLTPEERFKISEHIMQTIAMLDKMPFPPQLERVPEYAGTHHETMIGTGYPKRLDASQLSLPSRIMAVADIFEALTASDRPYKTAKTLSEAIKLLNDFKEKNHIDPEVFELFLTSGVYREYAEKYLRPEQLDEVDISSYLS